MTDTIIIGGGAAGCMAAIQAARFGKSVLLFERNDSIGVCKKKVLEII